MNWLRLFVYVMISYNLSFWLVYKDGPFNIFEGFRKIIRRISPSMGKVFECMNCTPTWIGMFLSALNAIFDPTIPFTPFRLAFGVDHPWFVILVFDAIFTSGIVYLIDVLETWVNSDDGQQQ